MKYYIDRENRFAEQFNEETGFYMRTGVIDSNGKDTGIDPFMRNYPQLIDIGCMGGCVHGSKGLCIKGGVECYQNGLGIRKPNMSLDNFKQIVDQCKNKVFQFALGGRGDMDQHENFEEILQYSVDNGITPNFTSSGLGFTPKIVDICKRLTGAVAISWYRQEHTYRAINMLLEAGIKTNIHYVLGNNSIDEAIHRIKNNDFPKGIYAVIFLLHKPVGLGSETNVLKVDDPKVKEFYELVDSSKVDFEIGFDSCNCSGIINFNKKIDTDSIDYCESSRHSAYIDADMNMMPCSFCNQDSKYFVSLKENSIQEAWNSNVFEQFRNHFRNSCLGCKDRLLCGNGCPIVNQITLCNRKERG